MLECDYLVVGAGASGMIFVDELLTQTNADIIMVDTQFRPGGHWNGAYPFVELHQPSAFYGAGSTPLGANRIATSGVNAGLYEQASGYEISEYFGRLMRERFLPSGRVRFLPATLYEGNYQDRNRLSMALSEIERQVTVRRRVVNTSFYNVRTPGSHTPSFPVVRAKMIPPNLLGISAPYQHYAVLGGGKTAMDTLLFLMGQGISPDAISWIVPRDSWLTNRETVQPGDLHRKRMLQSQVNKLTAYADATDLDDMFRRLEDAGEIFRIDRSVTPRMHYGATVSPVELEQLRKVKNVIRLGHVQSIDWRTVQIDQHKWEAPDDTLYIDCTARGLGYGRTRDVFEGKRITLQMVRRSLVSLSAAAIAFIEANYDDDEEKNRLCQPIPYGDQLTSWIDCALADLETQESWAGEPKLRAWLKTHRLMGAGVGGGGPVDPELKVLAMQIADLKPRAMVRLREMASGKPTERRPHLV